GIQKSLSLDGRNAQVSETLYEHMLLHNNGLTTEHVTSDHLDFGFDTSPVVSRTSDAAIGFAEVLD
uniref:hypothetical protein n=1 Tax=Pararhizobium sp. DWP1-1-3 TaxID=2804652 RepID=UPI003CEBE9A7